MVEKNTHTLITINVNICAVNVCERISRKMLLIVKMEKTPLSSNEKVHSVYERERKRK